ncbi:MAG TPA: hypothetical protein H9903_02435 [Candidatus Aquabacterium excrementipullorum]|nr:hypothetical protein [Candidatus Aquabacterium excrementipullorum]
MASPQGTSAGTVRTAPPPSTRQGKRDHLVLWGLGIAVICSILINVGSDLVDVLQDDYFYYHVIAENLWKGLGTSFLPGTLTNGYQPLWQFVVAAAVGLGHWLRVDPLHISHLFASATGYAAILVLLRAPEQQRRLLPWLGIPLLAMIFYFANMGMEAVAITLAYAVYLRLALSEQDRPLMMGVLLFICFMARIDSVVYIVPLTLYLYRAPQRWRPLILSWISFAVLAAGYAAINLHFYGVPVPVSGLAKNAVATTLHSATFMTLLTSGSNLLTIALGLIGSLIAWRLAPGTRLLQLLSLVLVVGFYVLHSLRSDYGVWGWYLYPFALHLVTLIMLTQAPATPVARTPVLTGLNALGLAGFVLMMAWHTVMNVPPHHKNPLHESAEFIAATIAKERVQTVAMGDRAGVVAYLTPAALVQLEGLVMDKAYLDQLRQQQPLLNVLKHYGAQLYIATDPLPASKPGCFLVAEPSQPKDRRNEQEICQPVIGKFTAKSGHTTVIFDVRAHE